MNSQKPPLIQEDWLRTLLMLPALLVLLLLFYHQTAISIVSKWWTSDTFAHGMVIIPFSLYMIWTNRQRLILFQPIPSWWGMTLLLPAIFIWVLGASIDALLIQQFALLGMVWALILAVLGWTVVKQMLFPLGFLFFTVPFGEWLIPVLRDFTAAFTVKALLLTGIPVHREGMYFAIPSGNFEVATACSGSRYLFASVALGCLFAYMNYYSLKKRVLFILVSILLPIVANGLRAYGIVLIAHYSNLKYAVGVDHLIYGWIFFGFIMFLLFYIGSKWREDAPALKATNIPLLKNINLFRMFIPLLTLLVAISGSVAMLWLHRGVTISKEITLQAPKGQGEWQQVRDNKLEPWEIDFKGASHEIKTAYTNKSQVIQLYVGYYAKESQKAELINQNNHFYHIKKWTEVKRGDITIITSGKPIYLHEEIVHSGEQERILWYGYDLNGFVTANIYFGKLVQAWQRLTGNDRGGAVIALMAGVASERQATIEQLKQFLKFMYPSVQYSLSEDCKKP